MAQISAFKSRAMALASIPARRFQFKLLSSGTRQAVDFGAAGVLGLLPLGIEPAGALQGL